MKNQVLACLTLIAAVGLAPAATSAAPFPQARVDAVLGRKAQTLPGGVFRYGWPRTDLKVTVADVRIASGLALGSWAAFVTEEEHTSVMGDLVLLSSEVTPVIDELQARGLSVTGIHNHLIGETPRVIYVHFMGVGEADELAEGLKAALGQTATPPGTPAASAPGETSDSIASWVSELDSALGVKGKLNGPVYSISVPRREAIKVGGHSMPAAMGLSTALNFQRAAEQVASSGDFVLIESEVAPVMEALREHGIAVTALHNHMLDDSPRLFFMHYWALGGPAEVGAGLRAALDQMKLKRR